MKMKKLMMMLAVLGFLAFGQVDRVIAQEEDVLEMEKDTLSIDDMDPVFYEGEQESGSNNTTIAIIVIGIVVVGGGAYYFIKGRKK